MFMNKKKNKCDVLIITGDPFPQGMANTNRIISYSTELAKTKKIYLCTYANSKNIVKPQGFFNGVFYLYSERKKFNGNNKILKGFYLVKRKIDLYKIALKSNPKSIIIASRQVSPVIVKLLFFRKATKIYREISEAPLYIKNKTYRFFINQTFRLYDGIISMTYGIKDYFSFISKGNFFILPMSVDISRFDISKRKDGKYFFYCGGGDLQRDGLLDIVKAFIAFSKLNDDYELRIACPINKNNEYNKKVFSLIENNPNVKIRLLGSVDSNKIPELMFSATAEIMTPHQDFKTKGFPTKLGEYLASAKPVICSSVSEIPLFLNSSNSFLVPPNSPQKICEAMLSIVNDKKNADVIGLRGRKTAEEYFVVNKYIDGLISFLKI